jgi:2-polyprenyl-3-methyl-5-hydroxy-6-metoxy-1,4-benzoquinol methylase
MSKYDFALDMATDNSNSLILRNIKPGSDVLETACAHGRMTRYLKETLGCRVTIVEYDAKAGASAAAFADDARHIGPQMGDLAGGPWQTNLSAEGRRFDAIVMADILEHLYDPWKALAQARSLLKPGGSIWISVPNFTHNGILIELWNGRFEYRKIGLLDNTHVRFFSAASLEEMVKGAGLAVTRRLDPELAVKRTELKNSYRDVPWPVALFLKLRRGGEIYQFVWELKAQE